MVVVEHFARRIEKFTYKTILHTLLLASQLLPLTYFCLSLLDTILLSVESLETTRKTSLYIAFLKKTNSRTNKFQLNYERGLLYDYGRFRNYLRYGR